MFNDLKSLLYRAVSINHLVTALLIGGTLASPITLASGEGRHETQEAETPHETQEAETPHETQEAETPHETQEAETPHETQ